MLVDKFIKYISVEKRLSKHTIISYACDINQFQKYLLEEFEVIHVSDISFQMIRSWVASLLEKGVTSRSVNRKISTLKSYFKFSVREGFIKKNPILRLISPKAKKRLPVFIEQDKIENLLSKLTYEDGFVGERNRLIIELFYVTGIRVSELINLKTSSIDINNKLIKVVGKRDKERLIPISKEILSVLLDFCKKYTLSDYLFTSEAKLKMYNKSVYRIVSKYIRQISSVSKRGPHILRHTFATHMLNNGADINAIKELLGHANLSATQVYTHNSIKRLKSVHKQSHPRF